MAIFSVISEGTEIKRHWPNIALFHTPLHLKPPIGVPVGLLPFCYNVWYRKLEWRGYHADSEKSFMICL